MSPGDGLTEEQGCQRDGDDGDEVGGEAALIPNSVRRRAAAGGRLGNGTGRGGPGMTCDLGGSCDAVAAVRISHSLVPRDPMTPDRK